MKWESHHRAKLREAFVHGTAVLCALADGPGTALEVFDGINNDMFDGEINAIRTYVPTKLRELTAKVRETTRVRKNLGGILPELPYLTVLAPMLSLGPDPDGTSGPIHKAGEVMLAKLIPRTTWETLIDACLKNDAEKVRSTIADLADAVASEIEGATCKST